MYIYISDLGDCIPSGNLDAVRGEWEGVEHDTKDPISMAVFKVSG